MAVAFERFIEKPLLQNFFLVKMHLAISNSIKSAPDHICFLKLYSLFRKLKDICRSSVWGVPWKYLSPNLRNIKRGNVFEKFLEKTCGSSFLVKMQVSRPEKKLLKINVLHFERFLQYRWKISEKVFIFQFYHSGISHKFCKSLYSKL